MPGQTAAIRAEIERGLLDGDARSLDVIGGKIASRARTGDDHAARARQERMLEVRQRLRVGRRQTRLQGERMVHEGNPGRQAIRDLAKRRQGQAVDHE